MARKKRKLSRSSTSGSDAPRPGTIVSHLGVAVDVRFEDGTVESVRVKRRSGHVVGDRVEVRGERLRRLQRDTTLVRRTLLGGLHTLAANLDVVGIVTAPSPETPMSLIDRAIVAARVGGLAPFVVVNKADMFMHEELAIEIATAVGEKIPVFAVSAETGDGVEDIAEHLAASGRGAFIGTSGVGKSSLLNRLLPTAQLETQAISEQTGFGRHTTTTSTLHILPGGGELVDTPGIRSFGVAHVEPADVAQHFSGFDQLPLDACKFRNCLHKTEPGCAIGFAVEDGLVSELRHAEYMALLADIEADIAEQYGPKRG